MLVSYLHLPLLMVFRQILSEDAYVSTLFLPCFMCFNNILFCPCNLCNTILNKFQDNFFNFKYLPIYFFRLPFYYIIFSHYGKLKFTLKTYIFTKQKNIKVIESQSKNNKFQSLYDNLLLIICKYRL